MIKEFGSHMPP